MNLLANEQSDPGAYIQMVFSIDMSTSVLLHKIQVQKYWSENCLICPFLATEFERLNPIKYVPALVDGEMIVADSFAILLVRHAWGTYTDDVQ